MGSSYYQFCPVAKAMELLDGRWTMLIVRELTSGSERFNELRRGLPRLSPALLSRRLHELTTAGIVRREADGADIRYVLTAAGRELRPIVEALGGWGVRWIGEIGDEDLDPKLLLWDMHRNVDHTAVPVGRTVVHFDFTDVPTARRQWWLVLTPTEADVCDADPGFPPGVSVRASLRALIEVWRGDSTWADVLRGGTVVLRGPEALRRATPRWFTLSPLAAMPRPATAAGRA
ncbi:helix-turn-helix domain-containing protein [Micromonospora purpureochromogenes]|uniref:winged helix-turn-helix transcriptional regulator n=1 Tax=Micromonospora purpureochromogenes TaxID=47872 RepID=UPI003408DADB